MTRSVPDGAVRPFGDRALLIGVHDPVAGRALAATLETALSGHDVELVCGLATVCVLAHDPATTLSALSAAVHDALGAPPSDDGPGAAAGRDVTIPCTFDGPDLGEVAGLAGLTPEEVVARLTAAPLVVSVVGFSPGFAYLDGLPSALRGIPRRDRPRPAVPAGSVALANGHAAVYPAASPGGWQLVGRTGFPLFSIERPPYAVLAPGDRVQFRVATAGEASEPAPREAGESWAPARGARPVFEVLAPGLRAVLQDAGRRGVASTGVPAAGAADPVARALANGLAGNAPGAAVLEVTGGGTALRVLDPCHAAVVGAAPAVRVDGADVSSAGRLLPLEAGQVLEVGALARGCRTYVAVAGGFLGPEVFGSHSSDELNGLGPGPVSAGATLFAGDWAPPLGDHLAAGAATELPADGPLGLRVVPGPHAERFGPEVLDRLAAVTFRAGSDSNRVGVRLRAEARAGWGARGGELDSQPMVTGAVQVPPGGDPIVLGPDHATLGGYPVAAVVIGADHGLLGQCGPGAEVRLVPVGFEEAEAAWAARRRLLAGAVEGHYPLEAG